MGTTSQKLTYLNDTKGLLKQKINNLGGDITDETTFRQYADKLQNVYDILPKTDYEEGSNITLSNTLKGKLDFENGIVGYGQTSQEGTPTPDNPQEIEVVRGTQTVYIKDENNNVITTTEIDLGEYEFARIGDYKDYIWTDRSTGKWYKHKAINKNSLPTISSIKSTTIFGETKNYIQVKFNDMVRTTTQDYNFYSNKFGKANGIPNDYTAYDIYTDFIIIVNDQDTVESVNEKFLNTDIYYRLATPIDTEIIDTTLINQLEDIYNIQSVNGTTIITSNGDLPLVLKVRALKG